MFNLLLSNLSATIDIIALAILVIMALYGLIEGFTKAFFSLFGTIIALTIAIIISSPVINFLQNEFGVLTEMSKNISGMTQGIFGKEIMQIKLSQTTEGILSSAGISGIFIKTILSIKNKGSYSDDASVSDVINHTFSYYIVLIIAVVVIFILLKLIFSAISKMVKKAYKNKSVASLDRVLGFALGLFYAIITIEIAILVINVIPFTFMHNLYLDIGATNIASQIEKLNLLGFLTENIVGANIIEIVSKLI